MAQRKPRKPDPGGLPDADAILDLLTASPDPLPAREIARAFALRGSRHAPLRRRLRELEEAGRIERIDGRLWRRADGMPSNAVLEVVGIDPDGDLLVRRADPDPDAPAPEIELLPFPRGMTAPGPGDRFVARMSPRGGNRYAARPLRSAESRTETRIGRFRAGPRGGRVEPLERGRPDDLRVAPDAGETPDDGDLVVVETRPLQHMGLGPARIVANLGPGDAPGAISRIAIHRARIPDRFSDEALAEAEAARPAGPDGRVDLRALPLVTIDGDDARDFDDAVHAEPDGDPDNEGGWHVVVAIADVAAYVPAGGALDREAYKRGNSVYFPDRVVPMLPEALSNGLCSLRPGEDRACLAADLHISRNGALLRHGFRRALMRSAARLTYDGAQAARDRGEDPVAPGHLADLYGAWAALAAARKERGALEIELPDRRVILDEDAKVAAIAPVVRLDSHRLIEEFMIAANVAAARELRRLGQPVMFRIHDEPDPDKLKEMRETLAGFGIKAGRGRASRPADLNRILARARGEAFERTVNELVLRAQMQAEYSPDNIGHFGLGLRDYAHFTSPIRRYADLLVHRALIRGLGLGDDGLDDGQADRFDEMAKHISAAERRAVLAERDAGDRYAAAYLADRIGQSFTGVIRGVIRAGLFVAVDGNGAEGFVPASHLGGWERPHFDPGAQTLEVPGGGFYRLGDAIEVRIAEADGPRGSAVFDLPNAGRSGAGRKKPGKRRRRRN